MLTQEPVAIFGALAPPRLLGSETGLDSILAQVLKTVAPSVKIITQQQAASLINRNELAAEYTRMRNEALHSHLLDRGSLKKLGTAIGTRYVFQPKLIEFMQITKDRWELPPILENFPYSLEHHATLIAIMGYADGRVALELAG